MNDEQVTEVLFNRGTLMDLYVGRPTFQRKLRPRDLLVDSVIDEKLLHLGHKKLLPKKATEALVTLEGMARTTLANKSLEFPLSGARFVYYRALPEVLSSLRAIRTAWDSEVLKLIENYDVLKAGQLLQFQAQNEKIAQEKLTKLTDIDLVNKEISMNLWKEQQRIANENLYPKSTELLSLFHFDWRMFKVSGLSGLEEMSSLQQEDLIDAQRQIKEDLQKWVKSAAVEMHKALGVAAANALNLLDKQDKLNPRNLKPLFDAFDNFKAIDFTGASTFQGVVEQIKTQFGITDVLGNLDYDLIATRVNGTTAGLSEFKALLGRVGNLAVDKVAEEAGIAAVTSVGEFRRVIEM